MRLVVGEICPSGFLPIATGNVRVDELIDAYRNAPIFRQLRDPDLLKGKCGRCEFRNVCGRSRARAYALTGDYLAQSRLLCGVAQPADPLRYGVGPGAPRTAAEHKPIVVWNITRSCNLHCIHCYSDSLPRAFAGELTWKECRGLIEDLASFEVPGTGGEPLIHRCFFEIASYAREHGLRLT
jgi:radical SAM protein with 4Fe4S-binding SPASM domain